MFAAGGEPEQDRLSARLLIACTYPGFASHRLPVTAVAHSPAWRPVLRARHTLWNVLTQHADQHTIAQAEQVLQDSGYSGASALDIAPALLALVYADLLGPAAAWCDRFLRGSGRHALALWQGLIGSVSALVSLREGHLDVALREAETAMSCLRGPQWHESYSLALATVAEAHTAIGSHEVVAELLARPVPAALARSRSGLHYLYARGRHHLATGRPQEALEDFLTCGKRMIRWNIDTPSLTPWRVGAAEASLALGRRREAADLIARPDVASGLRLVRSQGIELRCQAAVLPVAQRPPLLELALRTLQHSGDRYETARTLAQLGETYRALGDEPKARAAVRRARRVAENCRADEAAPTVARTLTLTDSERHVAALAAQGYTNRDISATIHLTVSAVEQNLTRVYRKLRVKNRDGLPADFQLEMAGIG